MTINNSLLENLIPNPSSNLFDYIKEIREDKKKKFISFQLTNYIGVEIEFHKQPITGTGTELTIEIPFRLILTHNYKDSLEFKKLTEIVEIMEREYYLVREFKEDNKSVFHSQYFDDDKRTRTYIFDYSSGYALFENKEIITASEFIIRYLLPKAA